MCLFLYILKLTQKGEIMKTFVFLFLSVFNLSILFSQSTPQPTPPSGGTNSVSYSKSADSYIFTYSEGSTEKLRYTYSLISTNGGACLKALTATVNGSFTYWPSVGGGVALFDNTDGNTDTNWAWESNSVHTLLESSLINNEVTLHWKTEYQSKTFFFKYKMKIEGRTLLLNVIQDDDETVNDAVQFNLDRSYSNTFQYSKSPFIIDVPYLTMFNILYYGEISNPNEPNNIFTTMFFDWTSTGCSRLETLNEIFDASSVRYSQFAVYNEKTDYTRNSLNETVFITVSPEIDDVLPNIPANESIYRQESVNTVIFDVWDGNFNNSLNSINAIKSNNINNLWAIIHVWQKFGYDINYPDVTPANNCVGFTENKLIEISDSCESYGYKLALHENYVDYDGTSPFNQDYDPNKCALKPDQSHVNSFYFSQKMNIGCTGKFEDPHWTKVLNSDEALLFANSKSTDIHNSYGTTGSYFDVHSSYDPSIYVDYKSTSNGAGKFLQVLNNYKNMGDLAATNHAGPVSGEGLAHFLYAGHYDDFSAQIHTGKSLPGYHYLHTNSAEVYGGYYKPLFVNFGFKVREKTFSHGVGYYERFFYNGILGYGNYDRSYNALLTYTATELAYGHGGFFTHSAYGGDVYDYQVQANIQTNFVLPMQQLNGNAAVSSIMYNDNGVLRNISDYIKVHPEDYACFSYTENCPNDNFMGQVKITYNNGVIVYVNRHPTKTWDNIPASGSWYNCHAYKDGSNQLSLETDILENDYTFSLPPENGWVCFSPIIPQTSSSSDKRTDLISPYKFNLSQNYPNPFNPSTEIGFEIAKEVSVSIRVYNILGQLVSTLINNEVKKPGIYKTSFDGRNFASGVYFYKIEAGDFVDKKKMVLIK